MKDKNELKLSADIIAYLKHISHGERATPPPRAFALRTFAALERRKLVKSFKDGSFKITAAGRKAVA